MVGIGKTAIAREIFEDPWILQCYDHRVWITLGPKYGKERLFVDFLTQLDPNAGEMLLKDDETSIKHIITSILSHKRCFIVLDDLCHKRNLIALEDFLEDFKCEVLVTTRILGIPLYHTRYYGRHRVHEIPFLNKDESWSLLRQRVFGDEACPHELEKAGKLIAENCDGLPLMIVTVADLLSEADDESPEYWDEVAETRSSVFEDAYQKISKTLYPCYKDLDLELRMSFLYMAAFRRKYDIPVSKLFMLYTAEGINPPGSWDLLNFKIKYFEDFVLKSLVLANQYNGKFKSCRLHSVFWHFCVTEAGNDRFLHVVSCYADGLTEVLENQRRLCIHSNVLFAIKDVYDSIAATSTVHSLLCFGPPHQYQVPICYDLKFLKVVDALTIRLYEFPIGILNLVLLRYLALTYNGKLPASISKLWSLEFLIIHRYMSIKLPGDLSYVPMEIWDMKELKHVQIMGSNLPDIGPNSDAMLEKLRILLDVKAESCTKSILDRIPNLLKLGIQIELTADSSEPSFSFDQISHLEELHSLKCVIVNPDLKPDIVAPPASFSMLPSGLKKVSLSGFGYPWECMRPIALLPKLQELRLKSYAFRGPEWVIHEGDFRSLYSLQLEDADLVHWRASYCHLQSLEFLTIKHCYKLKKIPWQCLPTSCEIQLVDCNPSASDRMPENYSARVYSSWEGGKTRANEGLPSQYAKFQFE